MVYPRQADHSRDGRIKATQIAFSSAISRYKMPFRLWPTTVPLRVLGLHRGGCESMASCTMSCVGGATAAACFSASAR